MHITSTSASASASATLMGVTPFSSTVCTTFTLYYFCFFRISRNCALETSLISTRCCTDELALRGLREHPLIGTFGGSLVLRNFCILSIDYSPSRAAAFAALPDSGFARCELYILALRGMQSVHPRGPHLLACVSCFCVCAVRNLYIASLLRCNVCVLATKFAHHPIDTDYVLDNFFSCGSVSSSACWALTVFSMSSALHLCCTACIC